MLSCPLAQNCMFYPILFLRTDFEFTLFYHPLTTLRERLFSVVCGPSHHLILGGGGGGALPNRIPSYGPKFRTVLGKYVSWNPGSAPSSVCLTEPYPPTMYRALVFPCPSPPTCSKLQTGWNSIGISSYFTIFFFHFFHLSFSSVFSFIYFLYLVIFLFHSVALLSFSELALQVENKRCVYIRTLTLPLIKKIAHRFVWYEAATFSSSSSR